MAEANRPNESNKNLLSEIEEGWESAPDVTQAAGGTPDPGSTRQLDELAKEIDDGWLDELFPDGEEEDDEDEEEEEPEPELPDERLDPVAYAAAKKEREERAARRKEKKRQKAEAKRARRKARVLELRQNQKKQKGRKPKPPKPARPAKEAAKARSSAKNVTMEDAPEDDVAASDDEALSARAPKSKTATKAKKGVDPRTLSSIKLLAIVLVVLLAAAAFAAAIMK